MLVLRRVLCRGQSLLTSYHCLKRDDGHLKRNSLSLLCTHKTMLSTTTETLKEQSEIAQSVFLAGVQSVIPSELVKSKVSFVNNILKIDGKEEINLKEFKNCHVVGFGKAVLPMAEQVVSILGPRCTSCIISVPEGTRESHVENIEIYRGAKDNIPDENAARAAGKILELVQSCQVEDLLIVLISGGGSALLPVPRPPVTIKEKRDFIKKLSTAGATINELNLVRTQLSLVKGGGLVEKCPAKRIISLILSDVLGDPLDVIASGPTFLPSNEITNQDTPLTILRKYIPTEQDIPQSILKILCEPNYAPRVKQESKGKSQHFIIGSNKLALTAALESVDPSKYVSCICTCQLEGEASVIGTRLADLAHLVGTILHDKNVLDTDFDVTRILDGLETTLNIDPISVKNMSNAIVTAKQHGRHLCLLLGGETVVSVKGNGVGGRNQELALAAALKLHEMSSSANSVEKEQSQRNLRVTDKLTILSCGTDGIDGPCPVAGAWINVHTVGDAMKQNLDPIKSLQNNDSYNFFKNVSNGLHHVCTGHTGTNVMDIIVILVG